jgi:hypothetical protein
MFWIDLNVCIPWILIVQMRLNSLRHIFANVTFRDLKSLNSQLLRESCLRTSLLSRARIGLTKQFGDLLRMIVWNSQWFNSSDSNLFRNRLQHDSFRMVPILLIWLIHQFGWVLVVDSLMVFPMTNRIVDFCKKGRHFVRATFTTHHRHIIRKMPLIFKINLRI